jgi:Fe-S cluster assembly protein SufD
MSEILTMDLQNLENPEVFAARQESLGMDLEWLREMQTTAWQSFLNAPMPSRMDERWRFARLERIRNFQRYQPVPPQCIENHASVELSQRIAETSGRLVFVDDSLVQADGLSDELVGKGVIFTTLADAMVRYPELVMKYFMQQSPELGSEKFEALHVAMLQNGTFLYVPEGVEVDKPFVVYNWAETELGASFPHTLFIAEKGAKASLVEFQDSVNGNLDHLVIANAHLYAGDNSKPTHTIIQNWSPESLSFQLNTSTAQANTIAKSVLINVGSAQARQEIHGRIFGSQSNVELYSLNVTGDDQEVDQRTLQTHIAPNSRSDLLYKNALMNKSRTIFSGLIIVEEDAQQTDAYQTNNNLMLSEEAESNSLPGLEIKANDVKCSHGATSGRIDESELFYFQARGIPLSKAQELMVFGYFEEIIEKLEEKEVAEYVRGLVQGKFVHS